MKAALVKHKRFKDVPKYNPAAERVRQRATWLEQVGLESPAAYVMVLEKDLQLLSCGFFVGWMPYCWMPAVVSLINIQGPHHSASHPFSSPSLPLSLSLSPSLSLPLPFAVGCAQRNVCRLTLAFMQVIAEEQNKPLELESQAYKELMQKVGTLCLKPL
jgi:hypothetical protein